MENMFCFQCEQTAKSKGCTIQGVCGKMPKTANLQDKLLSKVINFVNSKDYSNKDMDLIIKALFTTITNVNFDDESIQK